MMYEITTLGYIVPKDPGGSISQINQWVDKSDILGLLQMAQSTENELKADLKAGDLKDALSLVDKLKEIAQEIGSLATEFSSGIQPSLAKLNAALSNMSDDLNKTPFDFTSALDDLSKVEGAFMNIMVALFPVI